MIINKCRETYIRSLRNISATFCTKSSFADILPDHLTYNIPKYVKNPNSFDFPWLIGGAPLLEMKARFLPDQVFVRSQIPRSEVLRHFFKIYRGVFLAASQHDYDFINEYCEKIFAQRLIKRLEKIKAENQTLELVEDMKANKGYRLFPELHLYDNIIIKGINPDRTIEKNEKNYSICNDIETMGFISYIPLSLSDPKNFMSKEKAEELLGEEFKTVVFRAYTMLKSGLKLFVYDKEGNKLVDYDDKYTFNHVAVFECVMVEPPKFTSFSKTETYTEWISKHKFGVWKMIDLDHWMKGNTYFQKHTENENTHSDKEHIHDENCGHLHH